MFYKRWRRILNNPAEWTSAICLYQNQGQITLCWWSSMSTVDKDHPSFLPFLTIYPMVWIPSSNLGPEVLKDHTSFSKNITSTLTISHSFFIIFSGDSNLEKTSSVTRLIFCSLSADSGSCPRCRDPIVGIKSSVTAVPEARMQEEKRDSNWSRLIPGTLRLSEPWVPVTLTLIPVRLLISRIRHLPEASPHLGKRISHGRLATSPHIVTCFYPGTWQLACLCFCLCQLFFLPA